MIKNYITVALRGMGRNKTYTAINILGLSVGIACCLLLSFYIRDELRYDAHHRDLDRIYQVTSIMGDVSENKVMHTTSAPIVWGIKDELPGIETVARLVNPPGVAQNLIRYADKQFYETDGYIADSTLFDIFTYRFVAGNPKSALREPNSVVLTATLADKIFGDAPALGKVISINQNGPVADFTVTGVIADKEVRSHITANFFVSMTSSGWAEYLRSPMVTDQWAGQNFMLSYIKLRPGQSAADFIPKMNEAFLRHGAEDLKTLGMKKRLGLEPLRDLYLYASPTGHAPRIAFLYAIGSIAGFILLIACINFMNLSTARATRRASEVGLRKTLGAQRAVLIRQFLGEALIIVVFALIIGLALMQLFLPVFNELTSREISFPDGDLLPFIATLAVITVITGLAAGAYPAFYLSSFHPASVLKGKLAVNQSGNLLRKALVIFQFTVAIILACGMVTVMKQLRFMQEQNLGFDADNKLVLPLRTQEARDQHVPLRNELANISSVRGVSGSAYIPGLTILNDFTMYREGSSMDAGVNVKNCWVEPNYIDLLQIRLIAGRRFSENRKSEQNDKIVLNETAVRRLGFTPAEIVGRTLYNDHSDGRSAYEVIGVMEDYHQRSLREEIYPLFFRVPEAPSYHSFMVLDIAPGSFSETIHRVEEVWERVNGGTPFEFTFLDENIRKQYAEDEKVSRVIIAFTTIAMVICCMGLFGLSTFMAERRFREIGVRKVMGATVGQIVRMMSGEFIRLVLIAFAIATPLAWYLMNEWLQDFAYRIPLGVMVFLYAGLGSLAIALLTVSFESLRAASCNPVNVLRNE